jgi:hypothetical protein
LEVTDLVDVTCQFCGLSLFNLLFNQRYLIFGLTFGQKNLTREPKSAPAGVTTEFRRLISSGNNQIAKSAMSLRMVKGQDFS